ncbi:flavodoxin domain-containing protein [Weissella confusa]|uniref:flavodoxin domain-containing protein n=1 Tax=Weissella confusa TaxID=1583 RepID=UPI0022E0E20C|nr:flavodoxin domain-containing protein [Weissella confusa]
MSAVIIYDTKYGYTATYANWIADELHISKYRLDEIGALDLSTYDTIIFGGPIFNGRIKIANLINSELANLNACEIIFFSVGLHPIDRDYFSSICTQNFDYPAQQRVHFYQLQGAVNPEKLKWWHRMMVWFIKKFDHDINQQHIQGLEEAENHMIDLPKRFRKLVSPIVAEVRRHERAISLQ